MGAFGSNDLAISVLGAIPEALISSPGTNTRIAEPGEKPSARFWSVTSIALPEAFLGGESAEIARRRPVEVDESAVVNASFGQGRRHAPGSIGSHGRGAASGTGADEGDVALVAPVAPGCVDPLGADVVRLIESVDAAPCELLEHPPATSAQTMASDITFRTMNRLCHIRVIRASMDYHTNLCS
jgi:hypothetical protein